MGVQTRMRRRSVEARLARNVLVGDLKDLLCITVRMISTLPSTPRANVNLERKKLLFRACFRSFFCGQLSV